MLRCACSLIMALLLALGIGQVRSASASSARSSERAAWSDSQQGTSSFCDDGQQEGGESKGEAEGESGRVSNFAGTWRSSDGGLVQLSQSGDRVSGTYRGGAAREELIGQLNGQVQGNKLVAKYTSRRGAIVVDTGTFTLTRTPYGIGGQWASSSGDVGQMHWYPYPGGQSP